MASEYGKRPLWQWVVIYLIIGGIIYGLIYYFVFAKKGGYSYNTPQSSPVVNEQSPSSSAPTSGNMVEISSYSFVPATITVKVGDKVTWTNNDSVGHSATANDKSFDTGVLAKGQSGSATFSKAGTYTYYCSIHPNMHGTVIVQ